MNLVLVGIFPILSIGILISIPQAYSILENDQYTLEGVGFIISEESIANSQILLNFEIKDSVTGKKLDFFDGIISVSGTEFKISQNLQARVLKDGDLIRLSGLVEAGDRFTILGKVVEDSLEGAVYSLRGVIISEDDERKKVAYSGVIKSTIELPEIKEQEEIIEEKDFTIITSHTGFREIKQTYQVTVRAYEQEANPPLDFSLNQGIIEGVYITVKIIDSEGEVFKQFNGLTDLQGYFSSNFQVPFDMPTGKYKVDILAQFDNTEVIKQLELFISERE